MMNRLINILTSLQLTVVCLVFSLVLVFIGTVAQVDEGLYQAQARYFKSWYIWGITLSNHKFPIPLPGGYLIGAVLLVNLLAAHAKRFHFSWKKAGILMIHFGIILLLLGQLLTDVLSQETQMRMAKGEMKNYAEDSHTSELVLITAAKDNADEDEVVSIPESMLRKGAEITHANLPFTLRVNKYWRNSSISSKPREGAEDAGATHGPGQGVNILSQPPVTAMDEVNLPSAVIEVAGGKDSLGSWLVSSQSSVKQTFEHGGKKWQIAMRFSRQYLPFSLTLLELRHDIYKGTEIPRNFSSRVQLFNPSTKEQRETLIYMNNPLRYGGSTFYQYQMTNEEMAQQAGVSPSSTLQIVRNPGWVTPYLACLIVGLGLLYQFGGHLIQFLRKRIS